MSKKEASLKKIKKFGTAMEPTPRENNNLMKVSSPSSSLAKSMSSNFRLSSRLKSVPELSVLKTQESRFKDFSSRRLNTDLSLFSATNRDQVPRPLSLKKHLLTDVSMRKLAHIDSMLLSLNKLEQPRPIAVDEGPQEVKMKIRTNVVGKILSSSAGTSEVQTSRNYGQRSSLSEDQLCQ